MMRPSLLCFALFSFAFADDRGEILFRVHCAPCHGPKGDGGRGSNLAVPRLLRAPDDAALSSVIALGIPGTQMPATRMTDEENRQLVAFVRSLGRNQHVRPSAVTTFTWRKLSGIEMISTLRWPQAGLCWRLPWSR